VFDDANLGIENLSNDAIGQILTKYKTVAVVGLSRDSSKPSYFVPAYLKAHGFRIIPVNPFANEVLGEKCYRSLIDMPAEVQKTIEVIEIFRPSSETLPVVEQAVQLKRLYGAPFVVWMQMGVADELAARLAREAGMVVVMDRCMMQEHTRLFGNDNRVK